MSLDGIWLKNLITNQSAWRIVGAPKSLLKWIKMTMLSTYLSHIASLEKNPENMTYFSHTFSINTLQNAKMVLR